MKGLHRYSLVAASVVAACVAVSWWLLDDLGRASVGVAVAITLPLQIGFFALLQRAGSDSNRFLKWWAVGVGGRVVAVAVVALLATSLEILNPTVLVMSTAGFFFVLLLLEPLFLAGDRSGAEYAG